MVTKDAQALNSNTLALAAVLAALGALAVVSFAAWLHYGPEIFLTLADNGINWCL